MKFIEHCVGIENLQSLASYTEFDVQMASCEIVHVNGQKANKEHLSKKEPLHVTKMTNGVKGNVVSPLKKSVNGYINYETADDYELVLESSSDEGHSPSKKTDEDIISAPQIVQEIEDLLGIDSNSVTINDELKTSETESTEIDAKENSITSCKIPQEIEDVFEEKDEIISNKGDVSKVEQPKEDNKDETADSNSSSNMNVVFDEVEIGTDGIEEQPEIDTSLQKTINIENPCKSGSSFECSNENTSKMEGGNNENIQKVEVESSNPEVTLNDDRKNKSFENSIAATSALQNVSLDNAIPNDLPLTQLSDSSIEWTVIDSIEESEDDLSQKLAFDNENKPDIEVNTSCIEQAAEIVDSNNTTTVTQSDEDDSRKRSASTNDEGIICKKPKLEEEINDSTLVNLKRSCSESEHEAKRSKLCDNVTNIFQNITEENKSFEKENKAKKSGDNNLKTVNITHDKDEVIATLTEEGHITNKNNDHAVYNDISYNDKENNFNESSLDQNNVPKNVIPEIKASIVDDKSNSSIFLDTSRAISEIEPSVEDVESQSFVNENKDSSRVISEVTASVEINLSENKDSNEVYSEVKAPVDDKELIKYSENEHCTGVTSETSVSVTDIELKSPESNDPSRVISGTTNSVIDLELNAGEVKSLITLAGEDNSEVTSEAVSSNVDDQLKLSREEISDFNICKTKNSTIETDSSDICSPIKKVCDTFQKVGTASVSSTAVTLSKKGNSSDKDDSNTCFSKFCAKSSVETDNNLIETDVCQSNQNASTESHNINKQSLKLISSNETASTEEESSESLKENVNDSEDLKVKCDEATIVQSPKLNEIKHSKEVLKESATQNECELAVCMDTSNQDKAKIDKKVEEKTNSAVLENSSNITMQMKNKLNQINKAKNSYSKKTPFDLLTKHFQNKHPDKHNLTNIDKAIESVVDKAKLDSGRALPLLKKFHKDQLKKLTRLDLEETVVMKICEAITDRSEIGQMRLRCQTLEQNCELWRKKTEQLQKQNRELEMVLKRYLSETAQIKKENQNKVPIPIKVTRSVGLQVVLESTMHGALVSSKNKVNSESERQKQLSQQQQLAQQQLQQLQTSKSKRIEKETTARESVRTPVFNPPVPTSRGRGRPAKTMSNSNPSPSPVTSTLQPSPSKGLPTNTTVKPPAINRQKGTTSKDLEVIDLTDKDEKTKSLLQSSAGGSIRIAPSTQVCFMQNTSSPSTSQAPMAYLVQKPGQRQQFLVATSSPSPPRPVVSSSRPPPALAVPVFRTGGQIIPVQSNSQGGVRTSPSNAPITNRQVPSAIRLSSPPMLKHPAPLPPPPALALAPGYKSPPPKPQLKIAKTVNGIMLSWSMTLTKELAEMASYQLYAYQEGTQQPSSSLWKKVGDVKALPLPMACTLTQFMEGNKYHFAVRAVDIHGRVGPFSSPGSILLTK